MNFNKSLSNSSSWIKSYKVNFKVVLANGSDMKIIEGEGQKDQDWHLSEIFIPLFPGNYVFLCSCVK